MCSRSRSKSLYFFSQFDNRRESFSGNLIDSFSLSSLLPLNSLSPFPLSLSFSIRFPFRSDHSSVHGPVFAPREQWLTKKWTATRCTKISYVRKASVPCDTWMARGLRLFKFLPCPTHVLRGSSGTWNTSGTLIEKKKMVYKWPFLCHAAWNRLSIGSLLL